ncbi:speckle-type POZ protein-like A [Microplitis mediator]|uniref:speckle-type POZ protein-like A n=1 Tax=Microplitis mediator TaxID=375433 RepID=UPI002555FF27|nr:speckle-type POZ protein-like A [Microplitis mediator]
MAKGYTFVKEHKIEYEWEIKNISSLLKKIEGDSTILKSSEFSTGAKIDDKWSIELHLNNGTSPVYSEKYISLFLYNLTDYTVTAEVKFAMIHTVQYSGSTEQYIVFQENFKHEFKMNGGQGCDEFIQKEYLLKTKSSLIPDDVLTVGVEVIVSDNVSTVPIKSSFNSSKGQLIDDFKKLYKSKVNTDVTIFIGDKEFQAHKIIMTARSPVFSAMFDHEMIEKKTKQVSITDISPEIFEKVLEYIYTDQVTDLDDIAADLLEAADKYQLLSLKKMCEHSLCTTLKCDDVVKRMILADRHNAGQLLDYVTECLVADGSNIIETDDFEEFEKSSPSLGLLMFKKLVSRLDFNKPKITYSS